MTESASPLPRSAPLPFAVALLFTLVVSLGFVALILLVRRLGGALTSPLDFTPALAAGGAIALASWLLRYAAERIAGPHSDRLILAITIISWVIVVALTLS